jgi:hypothetical protein
MTKRMKKMKIIKQEKWKNQTMKLKKRKIKNPKGKVVKKRKSDCASIK